MVLSVARADSAAGAGRVHVSLSYAGFAQAYGGNYGSRLRLVELPGCALTTPGVATLPGPDAARSLNDVRRDWVGADVTLPGAVTASAAPGPGAAAPSLR